MIYWYIIPILHYLIFQIEWPDFFSSTAGDISFYSFEDNIQGYYSRENHKIIILKGKYEILV